MPRSALIELSGTASSADSTAMVSALAALALRPPTANNFSAASTLAPATITTSTVSSAVTSACLAVAAAARMPLLK